MQRNKSPSISFQLENPANFEMLKEKVKEAIAEATEKAKVKAEKEKEKNKDKKKEKEDKDKKEASDNLANLEYKVRYVGKVCKITVVCVCVCVCVCVLLCMLAYRLASVKRYEFCQSEVQKSIVKE